MLTAINFVWLAVTTVTFSEGYLSEENQAKINEIAETILSCRDIVGMNLAVVHNGETVFTNGYGVSDYESNNPVTAQTLFGIGSVTKHFTATLLGKLLLDNGLTWDDKVRNVLGEDFYFSDGLRTSQVTMRDLAAHRTGLNRRDYVGFKTDISRKEEAYRIQYVKPHGQFRNSMIYNNNMYDLMTYVTDILSGQTWEEEMREKIFIPAGMTSTDFLHTVNLLREDLAQPYLLESINSPLFPVNNTLNKYAVRQGGAGAIVSNAEDMAQWIKLQLNMGSLNGTDIISEEIIQDTRTNVNSMGPVPYIFKRPYVPVTYWTTDYALGWMTGWYKEYSLVSHSGAVYGYESLVTLLPDVNIGIYTSLSGSDYTTLGRLLLHAYIMDLLLDEEPWLNTTTVCTFPGPWVNISLPNMKHPTYVDDIYQYLISDNQQRPNGVGRQPKDFMQYTGTYGDFFYGNLTVYQEESKLKMQYGVLDPWELQTIQDDNIFFGNATGMTWPLHLQTVVFDGLDESTGYFKQLTASFDISESTVFIRDLTMDDAPASPNPDECNAEAILVK